MKETLHIKNFGPIKEVKLELGKVNVLIGDQGTGKSTVAKLLASIRNMATGETLANGSGLMNINQYGKIEHFKRHLEVFNIENNLNEHSEIELQTKYFNFNLKDLLSNILVPDSSIKTNFDLDKIQAISGTYFTPTERTITSLINSSILFKLNEEQFYLPKYISRFGSIFDRIKRNTKEWDFTSLLGIKYQHHDNVDFIILKDGKKIELSESASAIQTLLPLLVDFTWKNLAIDSRTNESQNLYNSFEKDILFLIEEIEINCFPLTQKKILEHLVKELLISNIQKPSNKKLLLTTHSPYILTSLNNLMYAYTVGQNHKEKVVGIIDEKYWLNPNDVSAYMMLADGTCEDIMDREEGMIQAEKIDEVSNELSEQFDELMNIEHNFKKHEL